MTMAIDRLPSRLEPLNAMTMHTRKSKQTGVGMIEVLIALFVLAIGMLGIAALQATALRNSQSSMERSQATMLSYNLFDAMRADLANARAGQYQFPSTCASGSPPAVGTPLAQEQVNNWFGDLRTNMGDAACAQVSACSSTTQACTVTIQWDDSRGKGGDNAQQVVTVTRL